MLNEDDVNLTDTRGLRERVRERLTERKMAASKHTPLGNEWHAHYNGDEVALLNRP